MRNPPDLEQNALLTPGEFQLGTQIVYGPGTLDRLGAIASAHGARRVMLVSDPGIVAAGHAGRGVDLLRTAGIETMLFAGARENPTDREVDDGVRLAHEFRPDWLIGFGGGSSLDCAKGINFVFTNGGRIHDYWGVGKATQPMLPMLAVPTTAGTGSELQSYALISDSASHRKMACGDKKATCRLALLDPALTVTQPAQVTALTGVDAISHALESHVTRTRTEISQLFSRQAWRLCANHFLRVVRQPHDLVARAAMQWGAALAGLAIENSMLGAAHALANPLTAHVGIAHGQAVGVMLPAVIEFNAESVGDLYVDLANELDSDWGDVSDVESLVACVRRLIAAGGLKLSLRELGVERAQLPQLAADAEKQWTGKHNPRPVDGAALRALYERSW